MHCSSKICQYNHRKGVQIKEIALTFVSYASHGVHVTARELAMGPVWSPLFKCLCKYLCMHSPITGRDCSSFLQSACDTLLSLRLARMRLVQAVLACSILCFVDLASAAVQPKNPTRLSSLPTALGVTVDYIIDGQRVAGNTGCTAGVYNSACLPQLTAEDENSKAVVSYQVLPNATVDPAARVTLRACYSAPSATDRTWRKANDIIELDRLCSFVIRTGLPLTGGPVEWTPTELVPNAVYFVRAYAVCPNVTYGTSQCGVGRSQGFFQINQINSRPNNLLGAVIGMCFAGPVIFVLYFGIDSVLTKKRGKQSHNTGHTHAAPDQMEEKISTLT